MVLQNAINRIANGSTFAQIHRFTTAGNFGPLLVPTGATAMRVTIISATSGGGSGRKGVAGSARFGGGGSAGANLSEWEFDIAQLGLVPGTSVLSGTVGNGGLGGASVTTNSTNGNNGATGGATFVRIGEAGTNYLGYLNAANAGSGGTNAAGNGGGVGTLAQYVGGAGSNSSATSSPASGGNAPNLGGGGGSAGSGLSTANAAFSTNGGGRGAPQINPTAAVPAGVLAGQNGLNGTQHSALGNTFILAHGASGGGSAVTGNAGNGGDAILGGGAGGGGAATNDSGNSGKGGNGAAGAIQIIFYFTKVGTTLATISNLTTLRNEVGMIGTAYTNTSAANTAAVITIASPGAGLSLQLNQLTFSYSAAPTNGLLTVQQGGTTIYQAAVSAAGVGPVVTGIKLAADTGMAITLSAGGANVIGHINASVTTV